MFVTVDNKQQLQVIATADGTVLATIPVPVGVSGTPPLELAMSPSGSSVYVFAPQARPSSLLWAIDTSTYRATQRALPATSSLGPLLISPDGSQLYFEVGYANEYVQVVDTATLAPVKQIPVNEYPGDLAVTPSGLILMTDSSNQLLVIDPSSSSVTVFPLPTDNQGTPGIVISSPDSTTAYISFPADSILALNIATGATIFNAPVNYIPNHFAISPDGSVLYSTNLDLSGTRVWSLSEFQIPAQTAVKTVPQLGPVSGLALTTDGKSLYVLNANESAIATVDVVSRKPKNVVLGGVGIDSVAVAPGGKTAWASQYAAIAEGFPVPLSKAPI